MDQVNGDINQQEMKKKKRSRGMHMISVVLYLLRRRRRSRKPFNNGLWRRFIEPFRQLKNDNIMGSLPSSNSVKILPLANEENPANSNDDRLSEMVEVFTATSSSSSSSSRISGYGSAKSLRDMDCLNEDDEVDECDGDKGDEMIDVKAEEFIVRFYEQMRMQNQAYTGRYKVREMMTV